MRYMIRNQLRSWTSRVFLGGDRLHGRVASMCLHGDRFLNTVEDEIAVPRSNSTVLDRELDRDSKTDLIVPGTILVSPT